MTLIVLLFLVGIILIAAEVILPGGIIGTLGGLSMAAAAVLAFFEFGNSGGFIALAIACAIGGVALFLEFRVLPKTKIGKRAFLTEQVNGVASAFGKEALELIGEAAEAVTPLSPSGYVRINGRRYEAFCQSGQAPAGSALEVIGADNFRLIVTQR